LPLVAVLQDKGRPGGTRQAGVDTYLEILWD
jgi:hypothetical protein